MRKPPNKHEFLFDGPAGHLEGLLERPTEADIKGCVVVCHPHPVHGGTMKNKVTHMLARSFLSQEFAALRFNFRGVGKSVGAFDNGDGELDDVLAAVRWLRSEFPDQPLWIAGFSFGAAMAVRAAVSTGARGLVSIAPAVSRFANNLDEQPQCPWLIVQGDQDELVDIEETVAWVNSLEPGPELDVFPETEHFFHGKLIQLRNTVEAFIQKHTTN